MEVNTPDTTDTPTENDTGVKEEVCFLSRSNSLYQVINFYKNHQPIGIKLNDIHGVDNNIGAVIDNAECPIVLKNGNVNFVICFPSSNPRYFSNQFKKQQQQHCH